MYAWSLYKLIIFQSSSSIYMYGMSMISIISFIIPIWVVLTFQQSQNVTIALVHVCIQLHCSCLHARDVFCSNGFIIHLPPYEIHLCKAGTSNGAGPRDARVLSWWCCCYIELEQYLHFGLPTCSCTCVSTVHIYLFIEEQKHNIIQAYWPSLHSIELFVFFIQFKFVSSFSIHPSEFIHHW